MATGKVFHFFLQAEDGIRDFGVTGVQTCALPICAGIAVDLAKLNERVVGLARAQSADIEGRLIRDGVRVVRAEGRLDGPQRVVATARDGHEEIGRASCRERVEISVVAVSLKKKLI